MDMLIFGLVVFLGVHSVRIVADDWRTRMIARWGNQVWKAVYSLISIVGFVLIIQGWRGVSVAPVWLWSPPRWAWHLTALCALIAFVLLVAAYIPRNDIKARVHDPMILSVKVWAFGHLIAAGSLAGVVLFGSFFIWAVFNFRSCRLRRVGLANASTTQAASGAMTALTVLLGLIAGSVFARFLHEMLVGLRPF